MSGDFEQRKRVFEAGYNKLAEECGVMFQVDAVHRRVGPQHQIEPLLSIVPIAGWQAPGEAMEVDGDGDKPDPEGDDKDD